MSKRADNAGEKKKQVRCAIITRVSTDDQARGDL